MRRTTTCTVCKRTVGVLNNWNLRQATQMDTVEWRISRHRATEQRLGDRYQRQQICRGSGVLVPPDVVAVPA